MKLVTHLIIGFSIATALAIELGLSLREAMFVGILALALNYLIDALGHRGPRRTPFLHSLLGVTLSIAVLFLTLSVLELYIPVLKCIGVEIEPERFLASYVGALVHLLLDAFTESGIYLLYPFTKKRFAIAHLDYDNPVANTVASALAILLLIYIAWSRYGYLIHEVIRWFGK